MLHQIVQSASSNLTIFQRHRGISPFDSPCTAQAQQLESKNMSRPPFNQTWICQAEAAVGEWIMWRHLCSQATNTAIHEAITSM